MQVPIYSDDINKSHGFKRLARAFQKGWPGSQAIQLSQARELLAQGLGYQSFHDLSKATEQPTHPVAPAQFEIQGQIAETIKLTLGHDPVDSEKISLFVSGLPFHALKAFYVPASPTLPAFRKTAKNRAAKVGLSAAELSKLHDYVRRRGTLRDQALLAFVASGARSHDFINLQGKHLSRTFNCLTVARGNMCWALPLSGAVEKLASYNCRGPEDFLFPAFNQNGLPMSKREFNEIFKIWLKNCRLDTTSTTHQARVGFIRLLAQSYVDPDVIRKLIGHTARSDHYKFNGKL